MTAEQLDLSARDIRQRDIRQREIVPPEKLASTAALVIGVGAIGRQVAMQLAALGMPQITLVDHDTVGVENLACQGYWPQDLGQPKVHATASVCGFIHEQISISTHSVRFSRALAKELVWPEGSRVVFCCVDSMSTRRLIWESLGRQVDLFIDGRMNAEVIRVLAASVPASDEQYPTTLFSDEESYGGSCAVRSTIYTASIAAGLMVGQFTRCLRGLHVERDILLNLLSSELIST